MASVAAGDPSLRRRQGESRPDELPSTTNTRLDGSIHKHTTSSQSTAPPASPTPITTQNNIISTIYAIYELSYLVTAYTFQPLEFLRIYLPNTPFSCTMGIFTSSTSFNPSTSIPSLSDKVVLVTGGNTGLGKETILQLARHGHPAKIYMGARSAEKAQSAINSIKKQITTDVEIIHLPLDLNSLKSVRQAAETLQAKESRLDILMCNAGIMATPLSKTEEGFEQQIGVNHLGHFYLTQQLLPILLSTAALPNSDVRVVSLTSEAHNLGPSSIDKIANFPKLSTQSNWSRYGASKAANIVFTAELARRHPQLTAVAVHPGVIMTDLHGPSQQSHSMIGYMLKLGMPFIGTDVPRGTYNSLWAATAPKGSVRTGGYYTPVGKAQTDNKWATSKESARRLWEWSEAEIKKAGF